MSTVGDIAAVSSVHNLGVIFYSQLSMADQVTAICFYQLYQLHSVVKSLTTGAATTLSAPEFISLHLD